MLPLTSVLTDVLYIYYNNDVIDRHVGLVIEVGHRMYKACLMDKCTTQPAALRLTGYFTGTYCNY